MLDEEERAGWYGTENGNDPIPVCFDSSVTKCFDFGNTKYSKICIFKYEDVNGDGKYVVADGDKPLPEWNIEVKDSSGAVVASGKTDSKGWFCASGLKPGYYYVTEEQRSDWYGTENKTLPVQVKICSGDIKQVWFGNTAYRRSVSSNTRMSTAMENIVVADGDKPIEGWTIWVNGTGCLARRRPVRMERYVSMV